MRSLTFVFACGEIEIEFGRGSVAGGEATLLGIEEGGVSRVALLRVKR